MRKRVFSSVIILVSLASVAAGTYLAAQRAKATPQRQGATGRRTAQRTPAAQTGALRQSDPNRAPQTAVDDALFTTEDFFGVSALVARPYSVALERVSTLATRYPKDARLHLHAARLSEKLGQFDRASGEMREYAELKGRSADALRRLASFYHNRAQYADEVRTLQELARNLPVKDRTAIYKRAAELVRTRALKEFKASDFFAELVAADAANIQPVKDYVEELRLANQTAEAQAVLAQFQPKFPAELAYFLKTRAQILEARGDRRAAEDVYTSAFDPNWPRAIASDYYDLMRRFGRYRLERRGLQERVRAGATDLQTVARLFGFYAYEGNYEQAASLIRELEARRGGGATQPQAGQPAPVGAASWNARELEQVAGMLTSIGHYDQASRYLYTLYLVGGLQAGSKAREDALYRLFKVMIDASGTPTRVATGDLSFYKDVAEVDRHPGFMNGVLSLILSGSNIAYEFSSQEKSAAGYFNRAFAYRVFTSFKQEYAQSNHLGDMYLGIINVFATLGEHRLAVEAGREFQQRYPDSPSYSIVSLRMADSYVALKDRTNERAVLQSLLDRLARERARGKPLVPVSAKRWSYGVTPQIAQLIDRIRYNIEAYSDTYDPTTDSDDSSQEESDVDYEEYGSDSEGEVRGPTYSSVLERYVSSLAAEEKQTETVAFFWNEIKKYPKEEGLYERFLRWLGQAQLVNEQLKAYNSAIRQFDSNTWYHRLGRWYVRQKRGRDLARYSRQLMDIFDEEEITEYLLRFAGYGPTATGDQLDWNQRLAYDLYTYAHNRFPRNLYFVRGMLTYLGGTDRASWEKLSAQYYFADRSIRDPYLAWLSSQNRLRDRYAQAKNNLKPAPGSQTTPGTYAVFAADAAAWLSHHDEAINAYRQLVAIYPGEPQYADRLADLTRSFGQQDPKLYEESARTLDQMADIHPADHSYRIKAGEVFAELGDFNRAAEQWNQLTRLEPGERETYLEVATVFWDYYQFDQSINVFRQLRQVTGDNSIYAYRMGAVYEGKGDIDAAVAEYVKVLDEPGDGRDTVAKRLAQLARRAGVADKIATAYQRERAAEPANWQLTIGYAVYQAERDRQADALAILRTEVAQSNDVAFLETVRDLFHAILRPEDEQQVLTRLASVARDEREAMMFRLQQASFLERHRQSDAALQIINRLVADYPTNVGVIEESAQFYWRAGKFDQALDLYRRSLGLARGANRRSLTLQFARHQIDAKKLAEAEATLRAFYAENATDAEVFSELARALGLQNKQAELATLYQDAFKNVRAAGLGNDETRSRVADLRWGMIQTLTAQGKYQDAVDQYIEIINTYPEEEGHLGAAIAYAEEHNLTQRLTDYYVKLSAEAFKNYRWQLVLARIYEQQGNLAGAADQYRAAVTNEPQRTELRFAFASTLARLRRYDEAIDVLREGWALAGRDPLWLIEVARIQISQGRRDDAVQTMRQALAAKRNSTAEAQMRLAAQLAQWGVNNEAVRVYEQVLARLPKTLKDEYISSENITNYVRALAVSEPPAAIFQKVERYRAQFAAIGNNSKDTDSYKAKNIVSWFDAAMRADFAQGVIEHATQAEASQLASTIQSATASMTTYGDREQLLRYLGIARAAALPSIEEQIQTRIKDAAFQKRDTPTDGDFYNELRALVGFYNRHASFIRAAELLAAEQARDPFKERFDYPNQIALQYRLAGNADREMSALRAAYAGASGGLTNDSAEWVERYLSLVYATGNRNEMTRLATSYSPYQLQLINFFVAKNELSLALTAINSARQTPAWVASRSGEVGLFLKDKSNETELAFRTAIDLKPIGQMIGTRVDPARALVGDDWFIAARNFGYWLGSVGRENDSRNFVVGEVESKPSSAAAQLELAAFYLDRKNADRAAEHTAMASELAPGARDVIVMRGAVAFARGDRKGATDAWGQLMAGRVTIDNAQEYLRVMADNGLLREALPQIENFLIAYVNRPARNNDRSDRMQAIIPLVRDLARRASGNRDLAAAVATSLHGAITQMPDELTIARLIIEEALLPEANLGSIYRTQHQRLANLAAAAFGTDEYENGYWNGVEYFYPPRALADWRKRFINFLIRTNALDEARLLIGAIKREQADHELALESRSKDESDYTDERYDWLPLASALIELRAGRDTAKAMAELRTYCGLDEASRKNSGGQGLHERCLKAYALLVAERKEAEADALLYDAYTMAVRSRRSDDASIAGLAEIEARRGRGDEASRLLKFLVERSTDNLQALSLAAETAARIGRYGDAVDFRERIARANPTDAVNRLELARAMAAAGRNGEAVDYIATLIAERATPNSIRAQGAEVIGDIVRADRNQATRAATLLDRGAGQNDAGALLARAAVAEATGSMDEARSLLNRISAGGLAAVAQMKLGLIALGAQNTQEAIAAFERAVYLDSDDEITDAIAFRAAGPRAQLVLLYGRAGRDLAAIRMAEGDGSGEKSLISAEVRRALAAGETEVEGQQEATSVLFEPSLEVARARATGLRPLAELNGAAAEKVDNNLLATLAQSAARLGQYDRAIAIERLRAADATRPEDRAAIERLLAEMIAQDRARRAREASFRRIDLTSTTEAIYRARAEE